MSICTVIGNQNIFTRICFDSNETDNGYFYYGFDDVYFENVLIFSSQNIGVYDPAFMGQASATYLFFQPASGGLGNIATFPSGSIVDGFCVPEEGPIDGTLWIGVSPTNINQSTFSVGSAYKFAMCKDLQTAQNLVNGTKPPSPPPSPPSPPAGSGSPSPSATTSVVKIVEIIVLVSLAIFVIILVFLLILYLRRRNKQTKSVFKIQPSTSKNTASLQNQIIYL